MTLAAVSQICGSYESTICTYESLWQNIRLDDQRLTEIGLVDPHDISQSLARPRITALCLQKPDNPLERFLKIVKRPSGLQAFSTTLGNTYLNNFLNFQEFVVELD